MKAFSRSIPTTTVAADGSKNDSCSRTFDQYLTERTNLMSSIAMGIAHEMKTPLGTSLMANSSIEKLLTDIEDMLSNDRILKSDLVNCVEEIQQCLSLSDKNLKRVNDTINYFKNLDTGKHGDRESLSSLNELICSVIESVKVKTENTIKVDLSCEEDIVCQANGNVLQQIFQRLADLSINHSFAENEIKHLGYQVAADKDRLSVSFTDHGSQPNELYSTLIVNPFESPYNFKKSYFDYVILHNLVHAQMRGGAIDVSPERRLVMITFSR